VDDLVDKLALLAREATADASRALPPAALERLEAAAAGRRARRAPRLVLAGAMLGVLVAVLAAGGFAFQSRPLTFEVAGASTSELGYISCPEGRGAMVRFSDHSELGLQERTRMRVSRLEAHGAHVMLESGSLHARIEPLPRAQWTLEAGPYLVRVTGTEFDMAWRADEQSLDVRMQKGSVIVQGPLAEGGVRLNAGEELVARVSDGELSILDGRATKSTSAPPAAASPPAVQEADKQPSSPSVEGPSTQASVRAPAHPSWRSLMAHGDFASILDDAEHRGMSKVLAEASAQDLATLGDAARYAHRPDVAKRALLSLRNRYPGSVEARDAAFFLGGLAEGQDDSGATGWYDVYLRESGNGSYAPQALGRKMLLVEKSQGVKAARPLASELLSRFPGGPYESAAHKVLDAP
jgi:TolA-binding protein